MKIKEIDASFICLGNDGKLSLLKLSSYRNLLLDNRELKIKIEDLKEKHKDEIEALEKEKLCKILTNKIFRGFN